MMKKTAVAAGVATVGLLLGAATSAHASLIYLGYEDPSLVPPSDTATMQTILNDVVSAYDSGGGTGTILSATDDGPFTYHLNNGSGSGLVTATIQPNTSVSGGPNSIGLTFSGYTGYLILGWDGKEGADQFYYLNNETGTDTFDNSGVPSGEQKGLSNYWLSSPPGNTLGVPAVVPEPSTVFAGALLLLPFGASVLRSYRKRS
jgi:hypothetical protein